MHPPHVPLEAEPESADVGRARDHGPCGRFLCNGYDTGMVLVGHLVEPLEELDGLEVLVSAEGIGNPFTRFPGIVKVEHGRNGIDAETVDMIGVKPEEGVGDQEAENQYGSGRGAAFGAPPAM